MSQLNAPMIDACRYKNVQNDAVTAIAANLILVADSSCDRGVRVPTENEVVRDCAGVSFRSIAASSWGEVQVCEGDTVVCTADGAVVKGDRVYASVTAAKLGFAKKFTNFLTDGTQMIVGVAKTAAADGELFEVELHSYTVGDGFQAGIATLVAGTVTVSSVRISASTVRILVSRNTPAGTVGDLSAPSANRATAGTFVINSATNADTSTVDWLIVGN